MKQTIENLFADLQEDLNSLCERYSIASLGLFGSYAREEQRENSDVDILVTFEQVPDFFSYIHLEDELSAKLQRKVDLVEKNSLKPHVKENILNEVQMIWEKEAKSSL
ncbi:MAG: nucleotidyltransferase family protein [Spirochaetota bacterium]